MGTDFDGQTDAEYAYMLVRHKEVTQGMITYSLIVKSEESQGLIFAWQ